MKDTNTQYYIFSIYIVNLKYSHPANRDSCSPNFWAENLSGNTIVKSMTEMWAAHSQQENFLPCICKQPGRNLGSFARWGNVTCVLEPTYHFTSWVEPGQFLSSRRILTQTSQRKPKNKHIYLEQSAMKSSLPKSTYQEETKINITHKHEHSFNAEIAAAAITKFN